MVCMRFTHIEFVNLSHRVCMHKSNFELSDLDNGLEKWCSKYHFSAHKLPATTVYHPLNLDYHPLQPQMELLSHYSYNPQVVCLTLCFLNCTEVHVCSQGSGARDGLGMRLCSYHMNHGSKIIKCLSSPPPPYGTTGGIFPTRVPGQCQ